MKDTICGSCRRIFKNDDICKYTIIENGNWNCIDDQGIHPKVVWVEKEKDEKA